jgi:hypothetical protein
MSAPTTEGTATATVTAPKRTRKRTTTTKSTTKKAAPAKQTKSAPAPAKTPAGPSDRKVKQDVAQHLINIGVDWFASLPSRTQKGVREVQFNGQWIARETVYESVRQVFAYTPAMCWHPKLGARDIGRGASTRAA